MAALKRLPDAEFQLMKIIWRNKSPITTLQIIEQLEPNRKWKPQTVLTVLLRLIDKKFLASERVGRERNYTPVISEEEYMRAETGDFISRYRGNSLGSLVKAMYDGESLSQEEIRELREWIKEKESSS